MRMLRRAAFFVAFAAGLLFLLTGCESAPRTVTLVCPPAPVMQPPCEQCAAWERPALVQLEDLQAALALAEAALEACIARNDGCVRREAVWGASWLACGQP